jgi:phosphoglycerol transferase MdoB-like AlkP superfamily enzyme
MSRGAFECAPGLFWNLGFDWAWFRENLEDDSFNVGYLGGDDFKMLEPAFEWVRSGREPFLLGVITSVAHDPFEVPAWFAPPKKGRYGNYLQAVTFSDTFVAELHARLEAHGLVDDTIVCVIGDHGQDFRPESNTGRWTPFDQVIRVPWVIRWPGHIEPGLRIDWPTSQLDVTPTLLSLLGFDIEPAGFDGVDALSPAAADRKILFATWYPNSPRGYVQGQTKYMYWPYGDTVFVYDLEADPQEKTPGTIEGPSKQQIIDDIEAWRRSSWMFFPPKRFRERFVYGHWRAFSSGRSCWAYYLSDPD